MLKQKEAKFFQIWWICSSLCAHTDVLVEGFSSDQAELVKEAGRHTCNFSRCAHESRDSGFLLCQTFDQTISPQGKTLKIALSREITPFYFHTFKSQILNFEGQSEALHKNDVIIPRLKQKKKKIGIALMHTEKYSLFHAPVTEEMAREQECCSLLRHLSFTSSMLSLFGWKFSQSLNTQIFYVSFTNITHVCVCLRPSLLEDLNKPESWAVSHVAQWTFIHTGPN